MGINGCIWHCDRVISTTNSLEGDFPINIISRNFVCVQTAAGADAYLKEILGIH